MLKYNIPAASEITPERAYLGRREFLRNSLLFTATSTGIGTSLLWLMCGLRAQDHKKLAASGTAQDSNALTIARRSDYAPGEPRTSYEDITTYNNFYEFGTDKSDPAANAHTLRPRPWTVIIEGEVARPQTIDIDQLLKWFPLEERVYRHALRRGLVDGHPLGWLSARRSAEAFRTHLAARSTSRSKRCMIPKQMPGTADRCSRLALRRGSAHRRGDAPA